MRRSMSCMASSSYIPAAAGTPLVQNGNIYHAMGPNGGGVMRGDSVAAMWPTLEVVRDIYSSGVARRNPDVDNAVGCGGGVPCGFLLARGVPTGVSR